jgi:16S rRNA (guanine966-N2)-methyltransferase
VKAPNRVRLTGGRFGGRYLTVPGTARPTTGRVREALFSIWADALVGARLLELFAGSGVVACEAVGRGARSAVLVDSSPVALRQLASNIATLDLDSAVSLARLRVPQDLDRLAGPAFDLVFADPPYALEQLAPLLAAVAPWLAADGEFVLEHGVRTVPPDAAGGLRLFDRRIYGESALARYRRG